MEAQNKLEQHLDFWILLCFRAKNNLFEAVIDRAYRDFSRTLKFSKENIESFEQKKDESRKSLENKLKIGLDQLFGTDLTNQEQFDIWHRKITEQIFSTKEFHNLSVGQAQKWINMTLKYLYLLGEDRTKIKGVRNNYRFYHIPIDNIILKEFVKNQIIEKFEPWSKIKNYDDYLKYQKMVRENFPYEIPMDVEFRLFYEGYE